jgi:hypothetical protein
MTLRFGPPQILLVKHLFYVKHLQNVPEYYVGQNLAKGSARSKTEGPDYAKHIKLWYDEVKDWPGANVGRFSNSGATGMVGHYTQLAWGSSKEVGCGYVLHQNGNSFEKVCRYPSNVSC